MYPLNDMVWSVLFRGIIFGVLAGFVSTFLFLSVTGKYGALARARPIGFVYFFVGVEIGIALVGAIVFLGFHALHERAHRMVEQSKQGGV